MSQAVGRCEKCEEENPYTALQCHLCGARLPWADAVAAGRGASKYFTAARPARARCKYFHSAR
jgi:hypothetical protein